MRYFFEDYALDTGSFDHEPLRARKADAAAVTGDEGGLAVELAHGWSPSVRGGCPGSVARRRRRAAEMRIADKAGKPQRNSSRR